MLRAIEKQKNYFRKTDFGIFLKFPEIASGLKKKKSFANYFIIIFENTLVIVFLYLEPNIKESFEIMKVAK